MCFLLHERKHVFCRYSSSFASSRIRAPAGAPNNEAPRVRMLGQADLPALLELRAAALAGEPTGHVRPRTEEELAALLSGESSAAFGIEQDSTLTAAALLNAVPAGGEPMPRIPAADWPQRAILFEGAVVHPSWRGRGFQALLLKARIRHARAAGFNWLCAGSAFANTRSLRNLLAAEFAIVGLRTFNGVPVVGTLRIAESHLAVDSGDVLHVPASDPAQHEAALARGYVGTALLPYGRVRYCRAAQ
jgi:GNAT superfamily N-acetyltransferase